MRIVGDFHLHGKYSRATSKNLTIPNLEKYAIMKGINILGTGDFQHPEWIKHLKEHLVKEEDGIHYTSTGFPFLLQTEISFIYTQDGRGRRVHNVVLAPSFEVAAQIAEALGKKGRLDYDGRPIFNLSCIDFTEMMMQISRDIEVIPAHAWTPWFSVFGSMGGFDSLKQAFDDQVNHIHAIETGLSSDPAMNWRVSELDNITLISNSDSHSFWPWRMGREANVFDIKKLSYKNILHAIQTREGLAETLEMDPNEGKYHYDGHRACGIVMDPVSANNVKHICPKCNKKLTIGVAHRVEELADRPEGYVPKTFVPFRKLIPLSELIAGVYGTTVATKKVWEQYHPLIKAFGSELNIMLDASEEKLSAVVHPKLARVIIKNRNQELKVSPGYDGEYGKPIFNNEDVISKQKGLGEF